MRPDNAGVSCDGRRRDIRTRLRSLALEVGEKAHIW